VLSADAVRGLNANPERQALMFHKRQYVGTATSHAYAFMKFDAAQTTDGTVVLDFADWPNSCGACDDAIYQGVRFRWQSDHIEMVGTPPPSIKAARLDDVSQGSSGRFGENVARPHPPGVGPPPGSINAATYSPSRAPHECF
jgi:hypothetical protein